VLLADGGMILNDLLATPASARGTASVNGSVSNGNADRRDFIAVHRSQRRQRRDAHAGACGLRPRCQYGRGGQLGVLRAGIVAVSQKLEIVVRTPRELMRHLPDGHHEPSTRRHVSPKNSRRRLAGLTHADVSVVLRLALSLVGVECRPKAKSPTEIR
jgi:hypothetical protein